MHCVCGYCYEEEWNRDATYDGGLKPFVQIDQVFTTRLPSPYHGGFERVYLYACPKCSTIKMLKG